MDGFNFIIKNGMLVRYVAYGFRDQIIAKGSLRVEKYSESEIDKHLQRKIEGYSHFTATVEHEEPNKEYDFADELLNFLNIKR